jgi:trans-feruloyl-CoA hydratase/vanillin synthase
LLQETMNLARKLEAKSPVALRGTKEAVRSVRNMTQEQALDYLNCKSEALRAMDKDGSRAKGLRKFLDEKSYKPGFGEFKR